MIKKTKIVIYALAGLAILGTQPAPLSSQVFFSTRGLLANHFGKSERVKFVRVHPTGEGRRRIERRLGHALGRQEYTFYVASSQGHIDGFALFDSEKGQHEMIDVATFFGPQGRVARVEVTAYREAYGDGIRSAQFRRQFVGRAADSSFRPGQDIDVISGATISASSLTRAVHRAAVLLGETVLSDEQAQLQASR